MYLLLILDLDPVNVEQVVTQHFKKLTAIIKLTAITKLFQFKQKSHLLGPLHAIHFFD